MFKKTKNIKKFEKINKRLDGKAKLFYIAYKNGKLNLDILNDDMKVRILKLDKESKSFSNLKKKLKEEKIDNLKTTLDNIDKSLIKDDTIDENEKEPKLSEKIITKFAYFKLV
jgi:alpha-N-acetylglucosamine transferase